MSDQFKTATVRAAYSAVVMGLLAGVTAYQTTSNGRGAILAGIITGLGVLAARGGVEGYVDTQKAKA